MHGLQRIYASWFCLSECVFDLLSYFSIIQLFKAYLRELPDAVITQQVYKEVVTRIRKCKDEVLLFPPCTYMYSGIYTNMSSIYKWYMCCHCPVSLPLLILRPMFSAPPSSSCFCWQRWRLVVATVNRGQRGERAGGRSRRCAAKTPSALALEDSAAHLNVSVCENVTESATESKSMTECERKCVVWVDGWTDGQMDRWMDAFLSIVLFLFSWIVVFVAYHCFWFSVIFIHYFRAKSYCACLQIWFSFPYASIVYIFHVC